MGGKVRKYKVTERDQGKDPTAGSGKDVLESTRKGSPGRGSEQGERACLAGDKAW